MEEILEKMKGRAIDRALATFWVSAISLFSE